MLDKDGRHITLTQNVIESILGVLKHSKVLMQITNYFVIFFKKTL